MTPDKHAHSSWNEAGRPDDGALSPPGPELVSLVELSAASCTAPCAALHLLDAQGAHCLVAYGLPAPDTAPLDELAQRASRQPDLLAIPDLRLDAQHMRWASSPLGFRFYAGAVLRNTQGEPWGILSILDRQPRHLTQRLAHQLRMLACQAVATLELQRMRLRESTRQLSMFPGAESEHFTRLLLDSISEGLCAMDRAGRITLCNEAFVRLLDYPDKQAVLGRTLDEVTRTGRGGAPCNCGFVCPIERAAHQGEWAQAACEVFLRPDGSQLPVEFRVAPIRDDGDLQGAICTFTDISERTREEGRRSFLLALSDRLQKSVDRFDLGLVLNPALARLLGVARLAYGYLSPDKRELRLVQEWHEKALDEGLGSYPLGDWSAQLAEQLAQGAPTFSQQRASAPSAPLDLHERLGCPDVLILPLMRSEHSVLLLGRREPRAWSAADLELLGEVAVRLRAARQRTRAIGALREAEQRISLANEIASIGVWEYNPGRNALHWDSQLKALAGLAVDDPAPDVSTFLQQVHPEDRQALIQAFRSALEDPERGDIALDYRLLDERTGQYRWLANRGRRVTSLHGETCILGITREITAERNAADALRQMNALLQEQIEERRIAERRQAAYIELGDLLRGQVDHGSVNGQTLRILATALGASQAALTGIGADGVHVPPLHAWPAEAATHAFETLGALLPPLRDGEPAVVNDIADDPRLRPHADTLARQGIASLVGVPRLEQGSLSCVLWLLHAQPHTWPEEDISFIRNIADRAWSAEERLRAEHALRELNDSLERRVAERTRELAETNRRLHVEMQERERAEEALRHAQKMEAIGQLTGGLAHDFNNMLTGVLGSLDLLQRRLGTRRPELDRYIDAAVTSANRAAALTHRLLAFARRQSLAPQPVNVNQLVISMEDMLRRTIGEHIRFSTRLEPRAWLAYTDAHQLENALLNLVINARDAMPEGGNLLIETHSLAIDSLQPDGVQPGEYVQLTVCDSGCGMPAEVIDKAFDPFFTTKPIGQGTGLGLSMVYGFVRQSGGQVRIESRVGSGTRVNLLLPRNRETPADTARPNPLGEAPRAQAGDTVLVVEDEAAVRMLVVEVLRELGYTALEATDSEAARPYLESARRIDLLVADLGLPGTNGRQLADAARLQRPALKVLFITGYAADDRVAGDALPAGMETLSKPFSVDLLAVRIRQMLETRE